MRLPRPRQECLPAISFPGREEIKHRQAQSHALKRKPAIFWSKGVKTGHDDFWSAVFQRGMVTLHRNRELYLQFNGRKYEPGSEGGWPVAEWAEWQWERHGDPTPFGVAPFELE